MRQLKDPILERYLAGDLPAAARARVEAALAASELDRARLAELKADTAAFLLQHPPGRFAAGFEQKDRRFRFAGWFLSLAGAVAAAAFAVTVEFPTEDEAYVNTKGDVALSLHRRRGEASVPVGPGETLSPGDEVRFEVRAARPGYVAVLGRDASGQVTVYHPFDGQAAAPYDPRAPVLSTAIELDEVVGREDVFALWSARPFPLGAAIAALKAGRAVEWSTPGVLSGKTSFEKR